ncbi:MAG TPA: EAL domain-containing protein, partial [Acidimicrobiales bacterium]
WAGSVGPTRGLEVAVNLSAKQLAEPYFVKEVAGLLHEHDIGGRGPVSLWLEITETLLLEDPIVTASLLTELRGLGVKLSIDDFGTGYSSLAYLRRFPVDALKVDKSFIDGLGREAEDSAIVRAVVNLAQTLGLDTVAEGVETEVQRDELLALDCTYAQGYLWAPPLPVDELDRMLARACLPAAAESA